MKVLVIGGTGLISGAVVRQLCARGSEVTIFHRGKTAVSPGVGVTELIEDRVEHADFVAKLQANGPWDCVIDMIGGAPGDAGVLTKALRGKTQHLIFCSTTTVYGRPFPHVPPSEKDVTFAPPSPYGCNKLACEEQLRVAEASGSFSLTIVRPAHTYGETSQVVHSLGNHSGHLDRMMKRRPIIVHDDGQGQWSAVWTDDIAAAIAAAAGESRTFGRTYHLAGNEWFTWDVYHRTLASALGAPPPEILHIPAESLARLLPQRSLQCMRTLRFPGIYDCSAAERDLGFRPRVTLAEGMARNVGYLRKHGLIERWENDPEYEQAAAAWIRDGAHHFTNSPTNGD